MFAALAYHRVVETPLSVFDVAWEQFQAHLDLLQAEGFVAESIGGLVRRLDAGGSLPGRYVLLTFDDGNDSDVRVGRELSRRGFSGSFAVVPGRVGEARHLDREGVDYLAREHHLASHTASHLELPRMKSEDLTEELVGSRETITRWTHRPCDVLALPGGAGGGRGVRLGRRHGYRWVATSRPAFNHPALVQRTGRIDRVCVHRFDGLDRVFDFIHCEPRAVARELARYSLLSATRTLLPHGVFTQVRSVFGRAARGRVEPESG